VAAVPISFIIAYLNVALEHDPFGDAVAIITLSFNGVMAIGYLDSYLPMLAFKTGPANLSGLASVFGARADGAR
jgi:hypothetical protein